MKAEQRAAFLEFATARSASLHRIAYLMVGDSHLAQDLVQEVLTKVYVAWPRVREPNAYCRRAITTTAVSWMRRKSWHEHPVETGLDEPTPGPDSSAMTDTRLEVWAALDAVPPRQRAALVLRFYEDLTETQTADALGCSVGTVKSQVSAGLKKLRAILGPDLALVSSAAPKAPHSSNQAGDPS